MTPNPAPPGPWTCATCGGSGQYFGLECFGCAGRGYEPCEECYAHDATAIEDDLRVCEACAEWVRAERNGF